VIVFVVVRIARAEETPAQRLERLHEMGEAEKADLFRHLEQFGALSPAEQERIRKLHQEIQNDPESDKLRETMNRYCQWLATLSPYERAELLDLKPSRRVKRIKEMLADKAKTAAKRLSDKDREGVVHWMQQYATAHEASILKLLPENRRHEIETMPPVARHRTVMVMLCQRWQVDNPKVYPSTTEQEVADLRSRISPEARARLESKSAAEQERILATWLRRAATQELFTRHHDRNSLFGLDEQLADYFEFQLNDEQRDRLMSLPGEEMQIKLRDMYFMQGKGGDPWGHYGDHLWRGNRKSMQPGKEPLKLPGDKSSGEKRSGKGGSGKAARQKNGAEKPGIEKNGVEKPSGDEKGKPAAIPPAKETPKPASDSNPASGSKPATP
jgi:hypothetical protein